MAIVTETDPFLESFDSDSGPINGEASSTAPQSPSLLIREEAMARLRVRSSHFSKLVAGKVRGLPPLPSIRLGRRQLFKEASLSAWIAEVEAERC